MQLNNLQMLKVILLNVLGEVVHLEEKQDWCRNLDLHVGEEQICSRYLDRAGHGAEGKHRSAVFDGGLTVKRSLSVNQQHGHLMEGDLWLTLRHRSGVNAAEVWGVSLCYSCQPCCHQACQPRRLRSRPGFQWSLSHSPPAR